MKCRHETVFWSILSPIGSGWCFECGASMVKVNGEWILRAKVKP